MSRSLKKPLYVDKKLEKKFIGEKEPKTVKAYARGSVISPPMIGHTLLIYNGKKFFARQVTQDMIGKKIGEFSPTRKMGQHGKAGKR